MPGTEFVDDPSIASDTELWRCIPAAQYGFDSDRGRWRPESVAFSDNSNGDPMSAFIADECEGVDALLALLPGCSIVRFTAGLVRQYGLMIARDPEAGGSGHVVIVGSKKQKVDYRGGRRMVRQVLAYECEWVIPPSEATP